jgi:hypothetical protein
MKNYIDPSGNFSEQLNNPSDAFINLVFDLKTSSLLFGNLSFFTPAVVIFSFVFNILNTNL